MSTDTVCNPSSLQAVSIPIEWNATLPICASPQYLRAVSKEYGWLAGLDSTGTRRCLLPFAVLRKGPVAFIRFYVETVALVDDFSIEEERAFLNSAVRHFRKAGFAMILPPANTALFRTVPEGANFAPYATFMNDLTQPEEILWKGVSEAFRKDIRKAANGGVRVEHGTQLLESAYRVFADTMKRSHLSAKSKDHIEGLARSLGDNVRIWIATQNNTVHASLITAFSEYGAHTLYGGTIDKPARGAMHLLHWEAIRQFRELGVHRFNFSGVRVKPEPGSKQEGIFTFKNRFGGAFVKGYMWKYPLRPLPSLLYSFAIRTFRGGDIVDLEGRNPLNDPAEVQHRAPTM